jgi:hypothetical protein
MWISGGKAKHPCSLDFSGKAKDLYNVDIGGRAKNPYKVEFSLTLISTLSYF